MSIDLTRESQDDQRQFKISSFFTNLAHRSPFSSIPLKRKLERDEESEGRVSSVPVANGNHHTSTATNTTDTNTTNTNNTPKPSPIPKHLTTPSPSPGVQESQQRSVSVVIPSPSRQLKREILNSEWIHDDKLTGLSERYYPTDAHEKRALKGAYPPVKRGNKNTTSNKATTTTTTTTTTTRRHAPLEIGQPNRIPILTEKPTAHPNHQLYKSFMRKLSKIQGPPVTLAPGAERMLTEFAANFEFVNAYKLRKGVSPVSDAFNAGCGCIGVCDPARCSCLSKEEESEDNLVPYQGAPDDPRLLVLTPDFLRRTAMIYECSARCGCRGRCWNNVVQKGRTVRFEIFHTGNRGFGLRSPDPIRAGQFIDCYLGEVIPKKTADTREDLAVTHHAHSYLFGLDFLVDDEAIYVVDGQKFGSPTRFMNHSCNPNCRIFLVSRNHGDERLYDLAFFAVRDIPPMTELTFDYNPGVEGDGAEYHASVSRDVSAMRKNDKIDPNAVRCLCGERNCRGQLWPNQRKGMK